MLMFIAFNTTAQQNNAQKYLDLDTVMIVALGKKALVNIPYQVQRVNLKSLQTTPSPQMMIQLAQLPSVSRISSGAGINKPVIRGLSFNHIQLFASGTRIDNQTWDDWHDIGISENGFDQVEIINGPAALIYGPNTLGGAMILEETVPVYGEKNKGFVRLDFFGNSLGGNINAGYKGSHLSGNTKNSNASNGNKHLLYYSANAAFQMHANYVQGEEEDKKPAEAEEDKPLAGNSKYNSIAFKGMIGIKTGKADHRLTYNLYKQQLGIIEDESANSADSTKKEEERDYEMEAPYQDVTTHVLSLENRFKTGSSEIIFNAGYQYNKRNEFEPDSLPKSKFLGVGLNLQTITGDLQWHSNANKPMKLTAGVQGFYQVNKNFGNFVLVPNADVSTAGLFLIGGTDLKKWNFLYGMRIDIQQVNMTTSLPKRDNGEVEPGLPAPGQNIKRNYSPYSFSAGLVYHPITNWSIKLNVANGDAAPNYAQLAAFGKHEGTYRFEIGDNNLKIEKNIEGDAGIEYRNTSFTFSVNGYMNSISNYIYITPTADSAGDLRVYRWTQHDALINGVEANINIHPVNLKWFESYLRAGIIAGKLKNNGGYLPYIPANKVIAGFTYKNNPKKIQQLYATLQLSYYGEQKHTAQFETATEGYFLADIFIGATPVAGKNQHWGYTVFCTNIFNKGYFNHLSLIKSIDVREPGRNIGVQVQYNF